MSTTKQDIVVIGAGVIGLATAYELAKRGARVTVVEEKEPGWAASHGNAGMILPSAGEPMINPHHMKAGIRWWFTRGAQSPFQVGFSALPGMVGWGLRALGACTEKNHKEGKAAMQELGANVFDQFEEYRKDGVEYEEYKDHFMSTFLDEKQFADLADAYSNEPTVEILSGDEARQREPLLGKDVIGAAQLNAGFTSVYPPSVCKGLAKRIQEMGVNVQLGVRVEGADSTGQKVDSLRLSNGESLKADHFVVAAGGWSGQIAKKLGGGIPLTGGKGYAITIQDPDIKPAQTIFLTEYEAVCIPFEGSVRLTGFLELSGVNMNVLGRRIKALRAVAGRYLKKVPEGKTEEHWTGMRACSSDGVPIIGKLPGIDNAWVGTGHWHFGLTLAPPTALMLAELITTGSSSVNARPFDPARF